VPSLAARRPNHHDEAVTQVAGGDEARFSVIAPVVHYGNSQAGEHQLRIREIEPALGKRSPALRLVPTSPPFMYPQKCG